MKYTVERKDLDQALARWQPIEGGWETPNRFDLPEIAESVARALALRSDGDAAFRVVDSFGSVQLVVQVTKYLRVYKPHPSVPSLPEAIPPGFEVPMLYQVLSDPDARTTVFLFPAALSETRRDQQRGGWQ